MIDEAMGDDVYQPDGSEVQEDVALLDALDTLDYQAGEEALDEGYSPPERTWAVEHTGVTASEQHRGETLDERLAEEVPDVGAAEGDGIGDTWDTAGEPLDHRRRRGTPARAAKQVPGRLRLSWPGSPPAPSSAFRWAPSWPSTGAGDPRWPRRAP